MSLFRRGGSPDFIDYTLLAKKGILKLPEITDDVIDLTAPVASSPISNLPQGTQSSGVLPTPQGGFDFLATLAANAPNGPSPPTLPRPNLSVTDIADVAVKLDTLEFKFERLMERFDTLEQALKDNLK